MKKTSKVKKITSRGLDDERFTHLKSDPKYNGLSNLNKKVVIEKRFASALTDSKFSSKAPVDKRGRPVRKSAGNDLMELYELEKSDEEEIPSKKAKVVESSDEESEDEEPIKLDLARGEGNLSSSDDSDSEESDWEIQNDIQIDADIAQLDHDAERVEWASKRLAACNLDWQVIKAEDIMVLVNSFKPTGGRVERISIYLSDFGKEKLEEEDKYGPRLDIKKPLDKLDESDELDPETKAAIRKYHIDLLKYYYAVIECDTEKTATAIYEQCDGFNFEGSGLKMDLRFIPEDMEFEKDRLKEEINAADLNLEKYKPKITFESGLLGTKGKLTWDENDTDRKLRMQDAFTKDENSFAGLIAESDSDDDEATQKRTEALKSLLGEEKNIDAFQIDWSEVQDKDKNTNEEEEEDSDGSDIEKALARRENQESSSDDEDKETKQKKKTNYKTYLERKKQKKRERKQQLKEAKEPERRPENTDVGQKKQKAKKIVQQTEETADKVATDDRFKALFTDSAFAIEQSSKEYKGSKLIEKQAALKKENKSKQTSTDDTLSRLKEKATKWEQKKKRKN